VWKLESFNRDLGKDLTQAARQYTMTLRYARVVWDCHFQYMQDAAGHTFRVNETDKTDETNDTVLFLWHMCCRSAAQLVMVLVNLARNGKEGPEIN
jgi:hypothetical protein